jgi:phosphoribosylglycinamide formyltransferase-1
MTSGEIAVFTYDAPHRKTQDVIARFLFSGVEPSSIHLLGYPWVERKKRRYLYAHRPAEDGWGATPLGNEPAGVWAKRLNIKYETVAADAMFGRLTAMEPEVVVVAGAGLIAKPIVDTFKVLNVHPGLLPRSRGLDILKWTILNMDPVGVTAHLCDDRPDLGWLIESVDVPVYRNDTFHSLAMRQYEMELDLLVPSLLTALSCEKDGLEVLEDIGSESRMRMPRKVESGLLDAFERYKRVYAI